MKVPYDESIYEPFGYGQLTNIGKMRMYEVGRALRDRYGDFLRTTYTPSEVYAYSTDYDRTKMSLQMVLAGLYPLDSDSNRNTNINWTPFSINYNRLELDFLQAGEACPKYLRLRNRALIEMANRISEHYGTLNYIMKNAGLSANDPLVIYSYYNIIECNRCMGLPLPSWLSEDNFERYKEIIALQFDAIVLTNTMKKLAAGATLKRFIENIYNQENGNDKRKMYLYSAHDLNVNAFLKSHGFHYPRNLEFGATVIMEKLRGPDDKIYIRLFVWSGANKKLALSLRNCSILCPLSKYLEIIKPVLPDGRRTDCMLDNLNMPLLSDMDQWS